MQKVNYLNEKPLSTSILNRRTVPIEAAFDHFDTIIFNNIHRLQSDKDAAFRAFWGIE